MIIFLYSKEIENNGETSGVEQACVPDYATCCV